MRYKVLSGFTMLRNGKMVTVEKGSIVEMNDKSLTEECLNKKLIERVDDEEVEDFEDYIEQNEEGNGQGNFEENFTKNEDFDEKNETSEKSVVEYLSPEEIRGLKNKTEVVAYGQRIGLDELNEKFTRDELDEMVIEYIENLEVENEDV